MTDLVARLDGCSAEEIAFALRCATDAEREALDRCWPAWAHHGQRPPHEDWHVWVMLAGRNFGKTRAGAEWVLEKARGAPDTAIAIVAANRDEARKLMIEGRSGLLAVARRDERERMRWEPSLGRLAFANGAQAFVYSGADGEDLRGPEHHFAWCDELAKWKKADIAWTNLMLGLRLGERPQALVTTTPRPLPALHRVLAMEEVVLTSGTSFDNPHGSERFLSAMETLLGGTTLGRQELGGELIEDPEGALWSRATIEASRCPPPPREALEQVLIGVDPPASADGDACGIVACGLGLDRIAYVLGDHSEAGLSPEGWARKAAAAAEAWGADRIVAEANNGGDMVEAVLRGAGLFLPVKLVHAAAGKVRRAEPVATMFEAGRAKLGGAFPALEDEMAGLLRGGAYAGPGRSPDRADAMVWALTELMPKRPAVMPRVTRL